MDTLRVPVRPYEPIHIDLEWTGTVWIATVTPPLSSTTAEVSASGTTPAGAVAEALGTLVLEPAA